MNGEDDKICDNEACPPKSFLLQAQTRVLLAYIIIVAVVLLLIVYFLRSSLANLDFYAKNTGFPSPAVLIIGMTVFLLVFAYITYLTRSYTTGRHKRAVWWAFFICCVSLVFWSINLALRVEYYVKGQNVASNGAFYLIVAIVSSLVIFYAVATLCNPSLLVLAAIPLIWLCYLLYNWWFKIRPKRGRI